MNVEGRWLLLSTNTSEPCVGHEATDTASLSGSHNAVARSTWSLSGLVMPNGVPFLFEGPTQSRFYFIGGDHWIVRSGGDVVAALQQKQYSWWHIALAYLLIPGTIVSAGFILYFVTAKPEAYWAGLAAALAAGLPMFYIHRTEKIHLARKPTNTFVLRSGGAVEIQGKTYKPNVISGLTLEYTFYQSSGAQGDGGYSELDVVLVDGSIERRINLLSQTANLALKHARKLEQLTGMKLKRNSVARNH